MHAPFRVGALGAMQVWIGGVSQLPDQDRVKAVELSFILNIFIYLYIMSFKNKYYVSFLSQK